MGRSGGLNDYNTREAKTYRVLEEQGEMKNRVLMTISSGSHFTALEPNFHLPG